MNARRLSENIVILAGLVIGAQSCESTIDFKGEIAEPKIVLYSILQPDSLVTVNIAKSYPVTDYKYEPGQITDAVVRLFCNNEFTELLQYVPPPVSSENIGGAKLSMYISQTITPVHGNTYRIEVEIPGFKTVFGETALPGLVPVISVDTSIYEKDYSWGNMPWVNMIAHIRFADPEIDKNYYMLQMGETFGDYAGNPYTPYSPSSGIRVISQECYFDKTDEPLLSPDRGEDQLGMYTYNSFNIFTDELISGKSYELKVKVDFTMPDTNYFEFIHFQVQMQSISKDLYLYLESYSAYLQTNDQFFSEPVMIYSNVKNGLGVVGAKVTSVKTARIGRYPVNGVYYVYE